MTPRPELRISFGSGFSEDDIEEMIGVLDEHGFRTENFEVVGGEPGAE